MPGGSPLGRRETKSIWALRCRSPANIAEHNKIICKLRPALALCGYIFPVAQRFIPGESNNCGKTNDVAHFPDHGGQVGTNMDNDGPNLQIMVFSYCFNFFVPSMENFMPRTGPINRSRRTNLFRNSFRRA